MNFEPIREPIMSQPGTPCSTTISAPTEKFFAKDKFTMDSSVISFRGLLGNFFEWFLEGDGKTEELLEGRGLHYRNLLKDSADGPIIEELGGEARVESTLTELYDLLKKQTNGKEGDLLVNGYANIFYIRDVDGILRNVFACWHGGYWLMFAHSIGCSFWIAGNRVFYRNFQVLPLYI